MYIVPAMGHMIDVTCNHHTQTNLYPFLSIGEPGIVLYISSVPYQLRVFLKRPGAKKREKNAQSFTAGNWIIEGQKFHTCMYILISLIPRPFQATPTFQHRKCENIKSGSGLGMRLDFTVERRYIT